MMTQRSMSSTGGSGDPAQSMKSASFVNSFRIAAVVDRISLHLRSHRADSAEFGNLLLSLARGIDFAVATDEVPDNVHELPLILKQICQRKNDEVLVAAVMVLMISVKNACKSGWFLVKDVDELMILANEIGKSFCTPADVKVEPPSIISIIMSRYFPRAKMGHVFVCLEVKSGFGAYVEDFCISKNSVSAQERIHLFVAQMDNISSSSCLISPPKVNFLLNGKGVDRRINVSMDSGPQFPTNVNAMLKYGTNLLQAIGNFTGTYIIIVALWNKIESSFRSTLQDYVQPIAASLESDSELIEGPFRISLNCPISFKRIKTPVKGQLCKHHQCFDYDNFIDINSRRPSWRCPHCNQSVCYTDLRVDQNVVKILREVGENVAYVIISSDGSWKSVMKTDNRGDELPENTLREEQVGSQQCEPLRPSDTRSDVVDLTLREYAEIDAMDTCEGVDHKPSKDALLSSVLRNETAQTATRLEDNFWAGIYMSVSNGSAGPSHYEAPSLTPVITDAISSAFNRESADVRGATHAISSVPQSQFSPSSNLQLQPQVGNSIISSEFGRLIPRNVSRSPIAVQALPVQSAASNSNQQSRASLNTLIPNGAPAPSQGSPSVAPLTDTFSLIGRETDRQQQFSRSVMNPAVDTPSSSMQHHSMTQNWDYQDRSHIPSRSFQQMVSLAAPSQAPVAYRGSPGLPPEHHNSQNQPSPNMRTPQMMSPPTVGRQSTQYPSPVQQGGTQSFVLTPGSSMNQSSRYSGVQRPPHMARSLAAVPVQLQAPRTGSSYPMTIDGIRTSTGEQRGTNMGGMAIDGIRTSIGEQRGTNMGGMAQPVSRADGLGDFSSEQNWRPTGRMRGSLSGQAFNANFNQFIIRPTVSTPGVPPAADLTSPNVPSPLQALIANNMNARGQPPQTYPNTGDATVRSQSSSVELQ